MKKAYLHVLVYSFLCHLTSSSKTFSQPTESCPHSPEFQGFDENCQLKHESPPESRVILFHGGLYERSPGFLGGSKVKESAWNAGDLGLISGLGRSPGGGNAHSSILSWRIPGRLSECPHKDNPPVADAGMLEVQP